AEPAEPLQGAVLGEALPGLRAHDLEGQLDAAGPPGDPDLAGAPLPQGPDEDVSRDGFVARTVTLHEQPSVPKTGAPPSGRGRPGRSERVGKTSLYATHRRGRLQHNRRAAAIFPPRGGLETAGAGGYTLW